MSVHPEEKREDRPPRNDDGEPTNYRLLQLFGDQAPQVASHFLIWLAWIPAGLGAVGAAIAYEMSGSLWMVLVGIAAGGVTGRLLAGDFLRWRVRALTFAAALVFVALFAWVYLRPAA